MNPVALYRFFKDLVATSRGMECASYKKQEGPFMKLLHAISYVLYEIRTSVITRRAISCTLIAITSKLQSVSFELEFDECLCCGCRMVLFFRQCRVRKFCASTKTADACPGFYDDPEGCKYPDDECPIHVPTESVAGTNAKIVRALSWLMLLNLDYHDVFYMNADADCKYALGTFVSRLGKLRYYASDDDTKAIVMHANLARWNRIVSEGIYYTLCKDNNEEKVEFMNYMPGRQQFTFTIPPFLSGPISRRKLARLR